MLAVLAVGGVGNLDDIPNGFHDGLGDNAVGLVVGVLDFSPAAGFLHGCRHGRRDFVGIEDDYALGVSRGPADGLDEGRFRAEEALFVRVQNGDEGDLRQVQALPEEVDAHQHVEVS